MPFSQIIPPSPSPTESKSLFFTSVSLLLSRIQGYHYHLSKFHIYVSILYWCFSFWHTSLYNRLQLNNVLMKHQQIKWEFYKHDAKLLTPMSGLFPGFIRYKLTLFLYFGSATPPRIQFSAPLGLMFKGSSWRRQWHPTPVLLPGKSHGRRSLVGCSPWGHKESYTKATSLSLFIFMYWRRKRQPTPVLLPGESQG